jgi:hypothetical protein
MHLKDENLTHVKIDEEIKACIKVTGKYPDFIQFGKDIWFEFNLITNETCLQYKYFRGIFCSIALDLEPREIRVGNDYPIPQGVL